MDFGSLGSVRSPLASIFVLTGMLGAAAPSTAAELCTTGVAGIATGCEAASALAQDLARRRIDRTLGTDPASDRVHRLSVTGSQPNGAVTAPFAMSSDGNNTNFNTSLTQWGSAFTAADIETLKQAQTAIGGGGALPPVAKPGAPQFDLWAQGRNERFNETGSLAKTGSAFTTYVGADYRWHRNLLIGGLVQFDDSRLTILDAREAIDGTAYMAGPYLAYRLAPNVVVDAKAAWGTAHDSAIAGVENMSLVSDRMLTEARLTGNWGWNAWQLSQSGAITYLDEASKGAMPGGQASIDVTRLSIGPELKRRVDMSSGLSVEPFAFFKSSLDLADATWASPVGQNTIGGGVTLAKPDKYNIKAMADFTESVNSADQVATGKVSVSVPASLLGF
jgi:hypothetical protein